MSTQPTPEQPAWHDLKITIAQKHSILTFGPEGTDEHGNLVIEHVQNLKGMIFTDVDGKRFEATWQEVRPVSEQTSPSHPTPETIADKDAQIAALREALLWYQDNTSEVYGDGGALAEEALSAPPPPAVVPLADVRPLIDALKECDGIAGDRTIAIGKEHDLYGAFSDIWDAASHALKDFTAKHPLP